MSITCEDISFKYGARLVLDKISIQLGKGYLYGILGPNGSGKTTFLKVLSGILKDYYGKVMINNLNIDKLNPREMAKQVAVVPQMTSINFNYSVKEIIMMGRYAHIGRFTQASREDKKIVEDLIEHFNLKELEERSFSDLSGGEAQKVVIARALAQQSKILLLDEPTTFLDINYKIEFMEMLKKYVKQGLIILVVLHDINLAAQFCDEVVFIKDGCIKAFGNVEETITRPIIKSVYNIDVVVRKNIYTNSIFITPLRTAVEPFFENENGNKSMKLHIVAGGGAAVEIFPMLSQYDVSVGIVNVLDDDYALANELNYYILCEAPFSPITEESCDKLKKLLKEVDLIILASIPFGKDNLKNLELINESGKPIIIVEKEPIEDRDFTNGLATKLYNEIKEKKNVKIVKEVQDILNFD